MSHPLSTPNQSFPNYKEQLFLYGMHTYQVKQGPVCEPHLHHRLLEINLVLKGEQTAHIGNKRLVQREGDILLIPPMKLHNFLAEQPQPMSYFVIHIQNVDSKLLYAFRKSGEHLFTSEHPLNQLLRPLLADLLTSLQQGSSTHRVFMLCNTMLVHLEEHISKEAPIASFDTPEQPLADHIAREIEALLSTFKEIGADSSTSNWLETISAKLGISRRHSGRVFQQAYGMSPRQYLSIIRQQEAMHMLVMQNVPLEEIAYRIGFENAQSFIRQFAKWTGLTPGAYRKQQHSTISYLTPLEVESYSGDRQRPHAKATLE
ncbi:helix-turn-helix transcriptional regulator [Paenibacillus sp. LHD-38]|uniref:AraC family transcriptional regulator n=1 Tax=Paenibacillus sp. LHD-38 TaxID=3072143 RepID=UPI00280C47B1|nr:helix-turn-helix transcriptional regulator [Paenibacillus sp. LHD-38]MDQ8737046.1 helix-turn-helix transcriptional regulator [Paenibacillus sp. LHD-38]